MKSPDEIKKGLEYLATRDPAKKAELWETGIAYDWQEDAAGDALAYIQQLEAKVAMLEQVRATQATSVTTMQDALFKQQLHQSRLLEERSQLEAERDAALADFKLYRERNIKGECGVYACDLCKHGGRYEELDEIKCPTGCMGVSHWQWRGVQKEEAK